MPGQFVTRDMTPTLQEQGYWSSFNIPAFNETYQVSGYEKCPGGTYQCGYIGNFRQLLFVEQQQTVVDLPTMQAALLYNDWQQDPLQHNSSSFAIAARDDLRSVNPGPYGGIDLKV